MKKSLTLAFCLCLTLSVFCSAKNANPQALTTPPKLTQKEFPNIFSPFGKLFRRLFRRNTQITEYPTANVTRISLFQNQKLVAYSDGHSKPVNNGCLNNKYPVNLVSTGNEADKNNELYSYRYRIDVKNIIGEGAKAIWNLSGVSPGKYLITADADDGCGYCGQSVTIEVCIVEE